MSYVDAAAIAQEFKDVEFTATTAVTTTDVALFIAEEEAFLDSRVSLKYAVPVTGTKSTLIMKKISTLLVVGRIKNILQVKTGDAKSEQGQDGAADILAAHKLLKMIIDDELPLIDAGAAPRQGAVSGYPGSDYTRTFQSGVKQW